jgi:phenylalanyl-tRNA synthetase beta chain
VKRDELFAAMKHQFTDDEFDNLCFEFGIELDDITSEKQMKQKEQGSSKGNEFSDAVIYKIDVPANRYDLLCVEGIARALRIFLGKERPPMYKIVPPSVETQKIIVKPQTKVLFFS